MAIDRMGRFALLLIGIVLIILDVALAYLYVDASLNFAF